MLAGPSSTASPAQPSSPSKRHLIVALFISALLLPLAIAGYRAARFEAEKTLTTFHSKQIVMALISYGGDYQGAYPDAFYQPNHPPLSSNEAFHRLFVDPPLSEPHFSGPSHPPIPRPGMLEARDEQIFGGLISPHQPDGHIGTFPDYKEALQPGENHWALVAGQSSNSSVSMPLLMEDPADPTWPPRWNTDLDGQPLPGRSWNHRRIFLMRNDGSGDFYKLAPGPGLQPIAPDAHGSTPFDHPTHLPKDQPPPRILDVAD